MVIYLGKLTCNRLRELRATGMARRDCVARFPNSALSKQKSPFHIPTASIYRNYWWNQYLSWQLFNKAYYKHSCQSLPSLETYLDECLEARRWCNSFLPTGLKNHLHIASEPKESRFFVLFAGALPKKKWNFSITTELRLGAQREKQIGVKCEITGR